ncbi:MAG: polysaccharide biosynthesis C-terminal domain-containing protein, partial [Clostridiales bacterium]|nr:polysaccharide biosynthesis C-terminal domain-containing protein [Clostridiales bacterium]
EFVQNGFGVGSAYIFQALVMLIFNRLLLSDEVNGVLYESIFGVLYTISTIPLAFFDGAGGALAPTVSIFAGEQDARSILTVLRQGILFTAVVSLVLFGGFQPGAAPILRFFGMEGAALTAAIPALRLFSVSFLFSGINVLMTDFWQAVGRARLAGGMSVLRNFVVILISGILLIPRFQITGLAAAYVCAEAFCFVIVLLVLVVTPSRRYVTQRFSPVGRVFEKYYSICTDSVRDISADVERLCEEWEVHPKQTFFLNFITEEILLNIIKFGLKDEAKEHYIDIKLLEGEDSYTLRIRDNVKAYDPFATEGDSIDNAVLRMIQSRARTCEYQRKLIFNYLYLVI